MTEPQPSTSNAGATTPSSGVLRTKISLKSGTVVPPFHTFKTQLPPHSEIQGNHDLLTSYGLGPVEGGQIGGRRVKESLSSFLPHVMGKLHFDATKEASSLRALIEKPPIHKEITNLSSSAMQGFKLSDGPVDQRYKHLFEKRHDSRLTFNEKLNSVTLRPRYDPYGFDEDETEKGFPKKHKKKKKDKKRKKDKETGDVEKKKKRDDKMDF